MVIFRNHAWHVRSEACSFPYFSIKRLIFIFYEQHFVSAHVAVCYRHKVNAKSIIIAPKILFP